METSMVNLALTAIAQTEAFQIQHVMRYHRFVPRLYNLCKSIGMKKGKIMPSRAFCSDESQGFPVTILAKHFGTFPFNHGHLAGIVATERHGPHSDHGHDVVILQASHVGYDPDRNRFGLFRRLQNENHRETPTCAKISYVLEYYMAQYQFAKDNITFSRQDEQQVVTIDHHLLDNDRSEGLVLDLDFMLARHEDRSYKLLGAQSTSKSFASSAAFTRFMDSRDPNATQLPAELFSFRHSLGTGIEDQLERNLLPVMPQILSAPAPMLAAAKANTQVEFDRTYRSLVAEPSYQGKALVFVSGINIDISPREDQLFPMTLFVPWAAYIQPRGAASYKLEQEELVERLMAQSTDNPEQVDLERAVHAMEEKDELALERRFED